MARPSHSLGQEKKLVIAVKFGQLPGFLER
jgi:hypothetical protein